MLRRIQGFTLVEIMIVVAVMGILLAIGMVSWGGYITWSADRARESDVRQWVSTFDLYKARYYVYPVMPTDSSTPGVECLGAVNSFPTSAGASTGANKCGQYKSSAANTFATATSGLTTAVSKVGTMPKNSHQDAGRTIIDNALVGPIVYMTQSSNSGTIPVTARFIQFFKGNCPSGFTGPLTDAQIASTFPLLASLRPSTVTVNTCYIQKDFSYTLG